MDLGLFHPIFVHFPIVLITILFFFDFIYFLLKKEIFFYYGHFVAFAALIFIIPSLITGIYASHHYNTTDFSVNVHQNFAYITFCFAIIVCISRVFDIWNPSIIPQKLILIFTVLTFCSLVITSDVGGIVVHGISPFYDKLPKKDIEYYQFNSVQARTYNPTQLKNYLTKQVGVQDVQAIFIKFNCIQCHQEQFENGSPKFFSTQTTHPIIWLPRDKNNQLVNWDNSPFYETVIRLNRMPYDSHKSPIGISWSDRLTLMTWLENGAPLKPLSTEDDETDVEEQPK